MRNLPLQWLLHEIAGDFENELRFQATAIVAPQEATEAHMLWTPTSPTCTSRVATMGKGIALAKRMRGRRIAIRLRAVFVLEALSLLLELEVVGDSATDREAMRVLLRLMQLALGDDYKGHFCVKARGQLERERCAACDWTACVWRSGLVAMEHAYAHCLRLR